MKCNCGGNEKKGKVTKEVNLAGRKVLVENVDAYVCDKCGETYFDGATLLRLEKQVQQRELMPA